MIHLFQPFWSFINTLMSRANGVLHCALLLHVAMQFGLYHLPEQGAWRKVSEDSGGRRPFLLIDCTEGFSLTLQNHRVTSTFRYSVFPAYSQVYLRNYNYRSCPNLLTHELYIVDSTLSSTNAYSYGRRLPGLRSRASPCG